MCTYEFFITFSATQPMSRPVADLTGGQWAVATRAPARKAPLGVPSFKKILILFKLNFFLYYYTEPVFSKLPF